MSPMPALSRDEVAAFLRDVFPQVNDSIEVLTAGPMTASIRRAVGEGQLRPGGTVSGPVMFEAADCAFYVAVMTMIGREALTVTTTLTINFLRKPPVAPLIAEARILRLGRTLATGDVTLCSEGHDDPVAHAVVSYAIPRR